MTLNFFVLILLVTLSAIVSFLINKVLIKVLFKNGIVEYRNTISSSIAIPKCSGISFVLVILCFFPIFEYLIFNTFNYSKRLLMIFLSEAIIALLYDIHSIKLSIRFCLYLLCSIFATIWIINPYQVNYYESLFNLHIVISIFMLLAFIKIHTFIDNIDMFVAVNSIHLTLTIIILCYIKFDIIPEGDLIFLLSIIILGWSLSFIILNYNVIKMTLGNVGSVSIGMLLAICLIKISIVEYRLLIASIVASLYIIIISIINILIKLNIGKEIFNNINYLYIEKSKINYKMILVRTIKCNILLMLLAINSLYYPIISVIMSLFVVIITLFTL